MTASRSKSSVYDQIRGTIQTHPRVEPFLYHRIMSILNESDMRDDPVYGIARSHYGRASYSEDGVKAIMDELRKHEETKSRQAYRKSVKVEEVSDDGDGTTERTDE